MKKVLTAILLLGLVTSVYALNFSQIKGSVAELVAPFLFETDAETVNDGNFTIRSTGGSQAFDAPMYFQGKNSNGDYVNYGGINVNSADHAAGNEDGMLEFYVRVNGTLTKVLFFNGIDGGIMVLPTGMALSFGTSTPAFSKSGSSILLSPGGGGGLTIGTGANNNGIPLLFQGFANTYRMDYAPTDNEMVITGQNTMTITAKTKAQLAALTPTTAGRLYYCSDCSTDGIVVSTGTGVGAFGRISARSTAIN